MQQNQKLIFTHMQNLIKIMLLKIYKVYRHMTGVFKLIILILTNQLVRIVLRDENADGTLFPNFKARKSIEFK